MRALFYIFKGIPIVRQGLSLAGFGLCFATLCLAQTLDSSGPKGDSATVGPSAISLPIFDAHVHFSHDAVAQMSTEKVIALMRQAGLKRAMVSSSDDEGTQKLFVAAPDLIVPSLRPYRLRSDLSTWVKDPTIITYLEQRLAKYKYAAVGEFHLYGADAELSVPRRMIELAQQYKLILHAHSDGDAIERIFKHAPNATVLWAHSGFDRPEAVRDMLRKYPKLFADLAYRTDQASPEWTAVFKELPTRFVVGTDTFTPERLFYIPEHARFTREWLKALPIDLAEKIAWRNGEALINGFWTTAQNVECQVNSNTQALLLGRKVSVLFELPTSSIKISQAFNLKALLCPKEKGASVVRATVDASMPEHQHGMNYKPKIQLASDPAMQASGARLLSAQGLVFHMPGKWQIEFQVFGKDRDNQPWQAPERLLFEYVLN